MHAHAMRMFRTVFQTAIQVYNQALYPYEHEYHFHYSFYYGCTKERSHLEIMKYNCLPDPDTKLKERTHLMVSGSNCLPDPELEATASNDFISMSVSIYRMRQLASYSASVKERLDP